MGIPFPKQENRFQETDAMPHIVGDACVLCKFTDCVEVCPVDAFHEGPNTLVINPDECIDCAVCVPECPTEAIFAEDDVSEEQLAYIAINAEMCRKWPVITRSKDPMPDAEKWRDVENKIVHLIRD